MHGSYGHVVTRDYGTTPTFHRNKFTSPPLAIGWTSKLSKNAYGLVRQVTRAPDPTLTVSHTIKVASNEWLAFTDGLCSLLQTSKGEFMRAVLGHQEDGADPAVVEPISLISCLLYAQQQMPHNGSIFSDCQLLVNACHSTFIDIFEFDLIV
ncbi:hypothetical protein JCGZ_18806 [Jatropha curcas]|uniref:Uncharacterized protein n=1 Tax=Jatropha curcas TaxID=180498 RepID=A0A067KCT7_JATCU|nr:hypothetical protein JCGZ_18806 [Jatropha curcas]